MSKSALVESERERLYQRQMLERISREPQLDELVLVYLNDVNGEHDYGLYSALVRSISIEDCLADPCWDLSQHEGHPAAIVYSEGKGVQRVEYLRYGSTEFEPIVIDRDFHGLRAGYVEISEEFRLFHRLYHDRQQDRYYKITDSGNEELVAIVEPESVRIRLREILQFVAVKEMHLSIQFDCREMSQMSLKELHIKAESDDHRIGLLCWGINYGDSQGLGGFGAFSRLLGKRLIPPLPKEKSGFWGFAASEEKKHIEFIIGVDKDGNEITKSCNEHGIGGDYLRAVHFRKEVLDKYFAQSSKYTVGDSVLWCGRLWCMYIDNHHDDKVCAWLGDLGRDLPYEEQLHWRSFNIVPVGGVSKVFFDRQLNAEFAETDRVELLFDELYFKLAQTCQDLLGGPLLLPLSEADKHYFKSIRVPATDQQKDFDELVLALTKILIDSLNERALISFVPSEQRDGVRGGIARLEKACSCNGVTGYEPHVEFLRDLQRLRSSGSAHRKGENYRDSAAKLGIDKQGLRHVFRDILTKGVAFLEFLIGETRKGSFKPTKER